MHFVILRARASAPPLSYFQLSVVELLFRGLAGNSASGSVSSAVYQQGKDDFEEVVGKGLESADEFGA